MDERVSGAEDVKEGVTEALRVPSADNVAPERDADTEALRVMEGEGDAEALSVPEEEPEDERVSPPLRLPEDEVKPERLKLGEPLPVRVGNVEAATEGVAGSLRVGDGEYEALWEALAVAHAVGVEKNEYVTVLRGVAVEEEEGEVVVEGVGRSAEAEGEELAPAGVGLALPLEECELEARRLTLPEAQPLFVLEVLMLLEARKLTLVVALGAAGEGVAPLGEGGPLAEKAATEALAGLADGVKDIEGEGDMKKEGLALGVRAPLPLPAPLALFAGVLDKEKPPEGEAPPLKENACDDKGEDDAAVEALPLQVAPEGVVRGDNERGDAEANPVVMGEALAHAEGASEGEGAMVIVPLGVVVSQALLLGVKLDDSVGEPDRVGLLDALADSVLLDDPLREAEDAGDREGAPLVLPLTVMVPNSVTLAARLGVIKGDGD